MSNNKGKLSPMMEQYLSIKEKNPDSILFFRLGDFYEMFFEDALIASKELNLTLTGKQCGMEERAPMCGVPFHAAENYIGKLISKGYRVAICEQVEDPSQAKGIVKREVIKIITPGTTTIENSLSRDDSSHILSIVMEKNSIGIVYGDLSTGEIYATEQIDAFSNEEMRMIIEGELGRIKPRELLISEISLNTLENLKIRLDDNILITLRPGKYFSNNDATAFLQNTLQHDSLGAVGLEDRPLATAALGGMFNYIMETQKQAFNHISDISYYNLNDTMLLDKSTIINLELLEGMHSRSDNGSLLSILNRTKTAMGSRLIKRWIVEPLKDEISVENRLQAVEQLIMSPMLLTAIRKELSLIYDFQRLIGRLGSGGGNGRDIKALNSSLEKLPQIQALLQSFTDGLICEASNSIFDFHKLTELINKALVDEPPVSVKDGGLIKPGFSQELDELKASICDAKKWIEELEEVERNRTGIKTLKVGYNKVFGYYIDITHTNRDKVPDEYIRKQTLVNSERYITPKLKEMEALVLNAEEKIHKLEYELFTAIREKILKMKIELHKTSQAIATIDVLASLAYIAEKYEYVRPEITSDDQIILKESRHPVIERRELAFVPNDLSINREDSSFLLITGPNMAGKSTYMRQTALIVLMAQIGSFVPCSKAHIGIVDRIFTRIGASDNLFKGESTFFVEMKELANILNNATKSSLVILDEIGRGTSTYDGMSIAAATINFLCNPNKKVRTLFATHYHELTALERDINGMKNYNVQVSNIDGEVVFMHRIIAGPASQSYGIHVAKLAGVPKSVLKMAENTLMHLEEDKKYEGLAFEDSTGDANHQPMKSQNTSLNDIHLIEEESRKKLKLYERIRDELIDINLFDITPAAAIEIVGNLQTMVQKDEDDD